MNQPELQGVHFLKELRTEVEKILNDAEHIAFLAKQLYKRYNESGPGKELPKTGKKLST